MARDTLLPYPVFNETFKFHTNARAFRLVEVIIQKGKPISFYSRKLTNAQQQYTVTVKELIILLETLKEFRTLLIGQILRIYTDNKNLTCKNFSTDRVLRWMLIIEEYVPNIEYIKGEKTNSQTDYQGHP